MRFRSEGELTLGKKFVIFAIFVGFFPPLRVDGDELEAILVGPLLGVVFRFSSVFIASLLLEDPFGKTKASGWD